MWVGLIRPDGYDCVQIDGQLSEYQKLVGGYLETVPTKLHGLLLLLDEEGKLKDKTPNIPATMLAGLIGYDVIVGDAVLSDRLGSLIHLLRATSERAPASL